MESKTFQNHFVIIENKEDKTFSVVISVGKFVNKKTAEQFIDIVAEEYGYERDNEVIEYTGGSIH